jgi:hypothetical protein
VSERWDGTWVICPEAHTVADTWIKIFYNYYQDADRVVGTLAQAAGEEGDEEDDAVHELQR